ncbi:MULTISPECIES: MFS transporter, partial [unclassified Frankia]|uniref:MFS transporter n=1 Tax=unclassified Frankia TaxID=2632575 RepID=UPI002AD43A2A
GVNATTAGLALFPEALGVLAGSQLAGRGYSRIGPRRLMVFGLLLVAAMLASISRMDLATSIWLIRAMMFLVGTGMGFVFLSAQTAAFARISPVDTGQASTLFNMQRQLASALGVGLVTTALTLFAPAGARTTAAAAGNAAAYHGAFLVAAALAVVAAGFALTVRDSDAANTMRPHTPDGLTAPRDDDLVDGGIPVAA